MFQDFALFPHLTVAGNVGFGLRGARAQRKARVEDLLTRVNLAGFAQAYPHQLSGGEQQRVALARALAPRPKVLLMDEPFSGLDNRLRDGIRDDTLRLLAEEETAVLLVTHDPEEAMRMADEIALMRDGRIVQRGAPYAVYTQPADTAAAAFFSDINRITAVAEGGVAQTAFGHFLCPGINDGIGVEIAFRPQHLHIDFDRAGRGPDPTLERGEGARATVERARFLGGDSVVTFRLNADGSQLTARVANVFLPEPGRVFWLTVPRNRCFVFPREV